VADERVSLILEDGSEAGLVLRGFENYRIRNDVRQMGASFDGKLAPIDDPDLLIPLKRKPRIRVEVDGTPMFRGLIVGVQGQADRSGSYANISCQDYLGYACKWDLLPGFTALNLSIEEAFAAALGRYMPDGTKYIGSNDANRQAIGTRSVEQAIVFHGRRFEATEPGGGWGGYEAYAAERTRRAALGLPPPSGAGEWIDYDYTIADFRSAGWPTGGQYVTRTKTLTLTDRDDRELVPHVGQTVGGFLREVCEHHRLLCWQAGDGSIIITRPRYDQNALITLARGEVAVEGTIESGGWTVNPGDQPAEMDTLGHGRGAEKVKVNARDAGLWAAGWRGYRAVVDENLRDLAAAQERSRRALHDAQLPTYEYHCRISGHGYGTYLFAPDSLMHVRDPKWRTDQDLYCITREWSKGRPAGTATELILVPPGLLLSE